MGKFIDLTGQTYGRLLVIERANDYVSPKGSREPMWKCTCSCEKKTECIVRGSYLRHAKNPNCGCYNKEFHQQKMTIHGLSQTHIYNVWNHMKQRCINPNDDRYKDYGGRKINPITVCPEWQDEDTGFINFYNDVSKLPHFGERGYTLNRIDNDGNYEIGNVEWADNTTQSNNRRSNRWIEYDGKKQTVKQWATELNIRYGTLLTRLQRGWSVERALNKERQR